MSARKRMSGKKRNLVGHVDEYAGKVLDLVNKTENLVGEGAFDRRLASTS